MGDDHHGVLKIDQKLLEPGDGGQVQMVGRLVHQQDVGVAEEGLREQDLHLFGAGKLAHHLFMQLRFDAEAV